MPEQAQVTSIEAIESFRASLIVFLSKARPVLEDVSGEARRMREWLQNDKRRYWEHELKMRRRRFEEAQQELFSARLSKLQNATTVQFMAVQKAQHALREADEKLAVLKKWELELENRTAPFLKLIDQAQGFLVKDMARAVVYLGMAVKTLDAYADVQQSENPIVSPSSPGATESASGAPTQGKA